MVVEGGFEVGFGTTIGVTIGIEARGVLGLRGERLTEGLVEDLAVDLSWIEEFTGWITSSVSLQFTEVGEEQEGGGGGGGGGEEEEEEEQSPEPDPISLTNAELLPSSTK